MEKKSDQPTATDPPASTRQISKRYQTIFLQIALAYFVVVSLLFTPLIQRNVIFLHNIKLPIGADFDTPERYGLSPYKTVNFRINSTDGISLGSWFTFSDPYFHSPTFNNSVIADALTSYPTVLYLHGNAATRAAPQRVAVYSKFSSRLHVNVLAIDYRGFGDSTGTPTEEGTIQDAMAAFDWLLSQGAKPADVLVVGHSLGSAVATQMTALLEMERDVKIRGLVLLSGSVSIDQIIETFTVWGFPILAPMHYIPGGWLLLLKFVYTHYFTLEHIPKITSRILIAHTKDDNVIPSLHSLMIFDKILEPFLPPAPPSFKSLSPFISQEDFEVIRSRHQEYKARRDKLVVTSRIRGDSILKHEFSRNGIVPDVVFLEALWGDHGSLPLQEGVQDVIRSVFGLGGSLI